MIYGYSNWYLLLLLLAHLSFSVNDNGMKKLAKIKQIPLIKILMILLALIVSVAIVFVLIQLANYVINDVFHLTGMLKTFSIIIAIILSLYPVKFTFGTVVYKIINDAKKLRDL